uniref:Uncharacterized protein n=1 Tax=Anguilla anguilla TaxID=7936 RepID=A0A0E9PQ69_ANGAN
MRSLILRRKLITLPVKNTSILASLGSATCLYKSKKWKRVVGSCRSSSKELSFIQDKEEVAESLLQVINLPVKFSGLFS